MQSPLQHVLDAEGWKQREFANAAGVSQGHVSEAVNGLAELGDKLEAFLDFLERTGRLKDAGAIKQSHKVFMRYKADQVLGAIASGGEEPEGV